jgi:hypothetical protein
VTFLSHKRFDFDYLHGFVTDISRKCFEIGCYPTNSAKQAFKAANKNEHESAQQQQQQQQQQRTKTN